MDLHFIWKVHELPVVLLGLNIFGILFIYFYFFYKWESMQRSSDRAVLQ